MNLDRFASRGMKAQKAADALTQRRGDAKRPGNPWKVHWDAHAVTCSAEDRISRIKRSSDPEWLRRVLAWRDNQLTVRKAAERRLRVLMAEQKTTKETEVGR